MNRLYSAPASPVSAIPSSESNSVAVAITRGLNSHRALRWVLDHLVNEGQTIDLIHVRHPIRGVPTPMGNWIPITQVREEAAAAHRSRVQDQTEDMLLPFQLLCKRRQVKADIRILEDFNVPDAIVKYVSKSGTSTLVMGSPSRNAISRRIKAPDVPGAVAKNAPKYCIMYVILKGKVSSTQSTSSSSSSRSIQVDVRRISNFDYDSSNCTSPSGKSQARDSDANDSERSIFKSRALSFGSQVVSRYTLNPENETSQVDILTRSESCKIGMCETLTPERTQSPTAPTLAQLFRSGSEPKRNLGPINEESQSVSMINVEPRVDSDNKTGLQGSAEISRQLPSITGVSNPVHEIFSNKDEIMYEDQSISEFQHDKQNSRLNTFGTKMEEGSSSMKSQMIGDSSETENTHVSSSPKDSEGKARPSLIIPTSEREGNYEENMELQTSSLGYCGWSSMAESSHNSEILFEISLSDLEARRPQISIVSKSLDCAVLNVEENALKFSQDLDERFASGNIGVASSSGNIGVASSSSGDIMPELEKLTSEISHIRQQYSGAYKEAVAAKKKVQELNLQRVEDSKKLETAKARVELAIAIAAEEMARREAAVREAEAAKQIAEIEAKLRKNAELIAKKNSQDMKKAKKALVTNDQRYRKYSTEEIDKATNFFSESIKIGEGAYGSVYRCALDHTIVAVKAIHPDATQAWFQFHQEVDILCRIRHPHIVLLVGACPESGCLVYEYMANGSLEDRLSRKGATPTLPWFVRFRIAWEVASGLFFLHSSKPEPLVHRDLKPANILLDQNFVSKIGDVGLARLVPPTVSSSISRYRHTSIAGTFCYIDPEYHRTGTLGTKSDLYAFGILLLQLLTAKSPEGLAHPVEIAIEKGTFGDILDKTVHDWPVGEAQKLAELALKCSELRRKDRPDLGTFVLPELQRLKFFADAYLEPREMDNVPQSSNQSPLHTARKMAMPKTLLGMFGK